MLPNDYIFYYINDYYVDVYIFTYERTLIMRNIILTYIALSALVWFAFYQWNAQLALQAV